MDGMEKLEQLKRDGAVVYREEITGKTAAQHQKQQEERLAAQKQKEQREIQLCKKAITERSQGEDWANNQDSIVYGMATLLFDGYGDSCEDRQYLLLAAKEMFPDLYTEILEAFFTGSHDT